MSEEKKVVNSAASVEEKGLDESEDNLVDFGDEEVTLESSDGKEFNVKKNYLKISKMLWASLVFDKSVSRIPVNVAGFALNKICEYANHHEGVEAKPIEKPLKSRWMERCVEDQWDAKFIYDVSEPVDNRRDLLCELIKGANYLDINSLLFLSCGRAAAIGKGLPLKEFDDLADVDKYPDKSQLPIEMQGPTPPMPTPN